MPIDDRQLPAGLVPGRRTPTFTATTVPSGLLGEHHTTVWATLEVEQGTVVFHETASGWSTTCSPGQPLVIVPHRRHRVEPAPDARFAVQFHVTPEAGADSTTPSEA